MPLRRHRAQETGILSAASSRLGLEPFAVIGAVSMIAIDPHNRAVGRFGDEIIAAQIVAVPPTGLDALEWARQMEAYGAGEVLLTSMDRDGTREGYDIELTRAIASAVTIPVIASGGVGTLQHIYEGLTAGGADAALAASIFHYREYTIHECKDFLAARGIKVRV